MVKREAQDAYFGAKLFYNGLMFFTIGIFFFYDNNLQKAMFSLDLLYVIPYLALFGLSYYLYQICGQNPGFLESSGAPDSGQLNLSMSKTDPRGGTESLLQPSTGHSQSDDLEKGGQEVLQEVNERKESTRKPKKARNQDTTDGLFPERRYCDICEAVQPYRTKHCDKCERCIHKFDHHCFWIGGCVGELNHRKFWIFLFVQTLLEIWSYYIADSGMDASYNKGLQKVNTGNKGETSPYTSSEYGAFTVLTILIFLTIIFTGVLLGFHTFLILTNQTTWEYAKKDRISYLKIYPKSIYPFSQGLVENIKLIFFHHNIIRDWELPDMDSVSYRRKKGFNWCENEYWSCC